MPMKIVAREDQIKKLEICLNSCLEELVSECLELKDLFK